MGDSPVMLSAAKHLSAHRDRPFASRRRDRVGADVSRPPPIDRPSLDDPQIRIGLLNAIIGLGGVRFFCHNPLMPLRCFVCSEEASLIAS
jgi:hypothetical protein